MKPDHRHLHHQENHVGLHSFAQLKTKDWLGLDKNRRERVYQMYKLQDIFYSICFLIIYNVFCYLSRKIDRINLIILNSFEN